MPSGSAVSRNPAPCIGTIASMLWMLAVLAIEPAAICEIADTPKHYEGKLVSVMAEVSVGYEMQRLRDSACPSSPLWFQFAEGKKFRGAKKFETLRKQVTAEVIGRVQTGSCFGHNCFSNTQIVVEEFRNITNKKRDFCQERRAALRTPFRPVGVWASNEVGVVRLPDRSRIQLLDPTHAPLTTGVFQLADYNDKIVELPADPATGLLTLPLLGPGVYPFSAAATGFQNYLGCIEIRKGSPRIYRITVQVGY